MGAAGGLGQPMMFLHLLTQTPVARRPTHYLLPPDSPASHLDAAAPTPAAEIRPLHPRPRHPCPPCCTLLPPNKAPEDSSHSFLN